MVEELFEALFLPYPLSTQDAFQLFFSLVYHVEFLTTGFLQVGPCFRCILHTHKDVHAHVQKEFPVVIHWLTDGVVVPSK